MRSLILCISFYYFTKYKVSLCFPISFSLHLHRIILFFFSLLNRFYTCISLLSPFFFLIFSFPSSLFSLSFDFVSVFSSILFLFITLYFYISSSLFFACLLAPSLHLFFFIYCLLSSFSDGDSIPS